MFSHRLVLIVMGGGLSLLLTLVPPLVQAENRTVVGAMVWGIVGYTRWPRIPEPLRVCFSGASRYGDAVRSTSDWIPPERSSVFIELEAGINPGTACDLVYVGRLPPEVLKGLVVQLAGKPVLTLGESLDFCSVGGMFCFYGQDPSSGFSANLDAISRSGLRVNPQVLRLSRQLKNLAP